MPARSSQLQKNISKLYCFAFLKMTLFPMAVITLFWKDEIGLSLTEILVLQAIFSVATVVLEYPSGYVSDRLGYRTALELAAVLNGLGWMLYTVADNFIGVLAAEMILGCGMAFISGSDNALLFETLRAEKQETQYTRFDGRMNGCGQIGEAAGALFAGVMYSVNPLLPFYGQIVVWTAALILSFTLIEPAVEQNTPIQSHLSEAWLTVRFALIQNPYIRLTIFLSTLLGLVSFYPVWLIQPYMQETGVPLAWFGPVWAGANLMVALCSIVSQRVRELMGLRGIVGVFVLLTVVGYGGLFLTAGVWSFLFYYVLTGMRGLQGPTMRNHLQRASQRSNRASILSLSSLVFRTGFVLTGPLVGLCADRMGLQWTFGILTVSFLFLLVPCSRLFLRSVPASR